MHKGVNYKPDITSAAEMWRLATLNGAISQGRENSGKLAVGCKADLILLDLDAINNIPSYDLYCTLAYSANASNVLLTMVDGRILYEDGEFKTIDIEKVKYDFGEIHAHYFDGIQQPSAACAADKM